MSNYGNIETKSYSIPLKVSTAFSGFYMGVQMGFCQGSRQKSSWLMRVSVKRALTGYTVYGLEDNNI